MFRQIALATGLTLVATMGFAQEEVAPEAETAPETAAPEAGAIDPAEAYLAARNQLGILKFCESQGFIGAEAIAAQEKMIGMLPEGDTAAGDAVEGQGAEGVVAAAGAEISLEEAAEQRATTVEAQCQQIETAVNQVAEQLPEG